MSMEYIKQHYGVPAKKGGRVKFKGQLGTITGTRKQYLRVKLDGEKKSKQCHPTWEMEYLQD